MNIPNLPKISYWHIITLTILFELVTIFNRFVLKLRAMDYTYIYDWATGGIRIYHAYLGLIMLLLGYFTLKMKNNKYTNYSRWLIILGAMLVLSDIIHHFIILPITIGSMEFT